MHNIVMLFVCLFAFRYGRRMTQSVLLFGGAVAVLLMTTYDTDRILDTMLLFLARALVEGAFVTTFLFTPEVYPTNIRTTGKCDELVLFSCLFHRFPLPAPHAPLQIYLAIE
jgi:hypothetical protein